MNFEHLKENELTRPIPTDGPKKPPKENRHQKLLDMFFFGIATCL